MSEVVHFEQYQKWRPAPPLVFIDMLEDQLENEDGFGTREIEPALAKCRALLAEARERHWPVAFVRPPMPVSIARHHKASRWIAGFEPRRDDMVFDRSGPSCYSNEEFAGSMDAAGRVFVMAGFSADSTGLATLIDASQQDHFVGLVRDATATRPLSGHDASQSHASVITVASRFGTIVTADHWIGVVSGTSKAAAPPRTNVSSLR